VTQPPGGPNIYYRGPERSAPSAPRVRRDRRAIGPQLVELAAIILFMVVAYNGSIWLWNRSAPREVNIPKVVGFKQEEAVAVLQTAGLKQEVVAEKYDEKVPEGVVISMEPQAGRLVKVGRMVRLTLSLGSRWSTVPEVQQMSVERAGPLIRSAKLIVGAEKASFHPKIPIGYVISQSPASGKRVPRNSPVSITISRGPEPEDGSEVEGVITPPATTGPRSYNVDFEIPPGPSLQEVRIVVVDENGEREVYRGSHQVGETVRKRVRGEGPEATVQVFLSGMLAEQHPF
jgi:beta-lactam-binding protein with PASTA domain